jgi:hypothetical protein
MVLVAASMAACSGPTALEQAPAHVRSALDPFVRGGYRCQGPSADQSAYLQWHCTRTTSGGIETHLLLDADEVAIKAITATIDQSRAQAADQGTVAAFFDQITGIDLGFARSKVKDWVTANLEAGGHFRVDGVLVTLAPLQPVDDLALFVVE